jgi:hypothetical protein
VNRGVCSGKVISDLHFRSYLKKKKPPGVASIYLEIAKVVDIINFANEGVVIL